MRCKHQELNRKEGRCGDYYFSHKLINKSEKQKLVDSLGEDYSTRKAIEICMCRLPEWKKKKKVCPYDKKIRSCCARVKGQEQLK